MIEEISSTDGTGVNGKEAIGIFKTDIGLVPAHF